MKTLLKFVAVVYVHYWTERLQMKPDPRYIITDYFIFGIPVYTKVTKK